MEGEVTLAAAVVAVVAFCSSGLDSGLPTSESSIAMISTQVRNESVSTIKNNIEITETKKTAIATGSEDHHMLFSFA